MMADSRNRLSDPKLRIVEAEKVLASAIATLEAATRADKVVVSSAVSEALRQLDEARLLLLSIDEAIDTAEEPRLSELSDKPPT
jgi:uncharacterized protein YpiB (UPF0302 family)